ncbi:GAF and ANTAR domain-containing protein [Streptomyces phytohabitans]|uniref:GAF and ANTAR domain-containing protein n=1 Tax=Streptomyces phytohabitans TaxID=1150371 RepID=UPI00345BE728
MSWRRFAQQMATMSRDLLKQDSVDTTLARITASATELIGDCDAAGILVVHGGAVETLAPTGQLVIDSDAVQERLGEGPCFDTAQATSEEPVFRIPDLAAQEQRWPRFAPEARELGIGSMMGFLLFTDDENDFGALNLYSRKPGAFTEDSEMAGWLLASHAAVAFSGARTHGRMEYAVATRHTIGQAMGILMNSRNLTSEQAFDVLRRYSQERNIKLREVARQLNEQGSLP